MIKRFSTSPQRALWRLCVFAIFCLSTIWAKAQPAILSISPEPGSTISTLTSVSITFTEPVAGVDASDLLVNAIAAQTASGSGAGPYIFQFSQPQPGTVSISFDFDHGITGIGSGAFLADDGWVYSLIDNQPPLIAQTQTSAPGQEQSAITPLPGSTVGPLTQIELFFSEPVIGVDAADLLVNGVPASSVQGTEAGPYVFTFSQPAVGNVVFEWTPGHGIQDRADPPNAFAGGNWTVTRSANGPGSLIINEFLAANGTGLQDEDGDRPDWIEIRNTGAVSVNVLGWGLSSDSDRPNEWVFPSRTIAPGGYLLVFASGKDRKPGSGNLHANFRLNENRPYLILSAPEYPRPATSDFSDAPVQRYDYSYGYTPASTLRYFSQPTPGAANPNSSLTSVAIPPVASVSRGIFKDPFPLVLSAPGPSSVVRYTLDGSLPTPGSPAYDTPLNISSTTVLRAIAFAPDAVPSETVTHSYLFLDQTLSQPSPPYDNPARSDDDTNPPLPTVGGLPLPIAWGTAGSGFPGQITNLDAGQVPADYGMDPEIIFDPTKRNDLGAIDAAGRTNLDRIRKGLRSLPILSVVLPVPDVFGPNGLYPRSQVKGSTYEKPCSVEFIMPDGSSGFATTAGIRIHGNASRAPQNSPKHGFKLKFKGSYGASTLDYQLFPDSPVRKFDDLVLRADYNSSWLHWDGSTGVSGQRPRGTRVRDAFCKDTFRDMGRPAGRHRYVHLFINGIYWGTYDPTEQENDSFGEAYFGGDKRDYDVVEQGLLQSGTLTAYQAMTSIAAPITDPKYEQFKQYLDVPHFIDYMLLHFFVGHQDWGDDMNKNWYAIRNAKTNGTFKYLPWDMENLLWSQSVDRTGVSNSPSGIHPKLAANPQYQLDFADRVHRHMIAPDGALLPAANIARWNKWREIINADVIACESARWGDYRRDVHRFSTAPFDLYTWHNQWVAEHTRLLTTYFPVRTANVLTQLRNRGLYPTLNAPEARNDATNTLLANSRVAPGTLVRLVLPSPAPPGTVNSGTIYYTTDGNDPRVTYTGAVNTASANAYTVPIFIGSTTTIKARTLNSGVWSALNDVTLTVGSAFSPIRITEIMYNPPAAMGGNAAEFLELQNTGGTAVDIGGYSFTGINFVFPAGFTVGAGARIVLANNNSPTTFAAQYPSVLVAGYYGGNLDNSGERIALIDATGRTVVSVDYDDDPPWPLSPDGGGYSLEIIDPLGDPDDPFNWKASDMLKGTPGLPNSPPAPVSIRISEVLARNVSAVNVNGIFPDYVELHNPGANAVDVSGWTLQSSNVFVFPGGTIIAPNGYLVVYCHPGGLPGLSTGGPPLWDHFGQIILRQAGTLIDAVTYGQQAANHSIGRVSGSWTLVVPSPGAANSAAATASVSQIAFNEWYADTLPGEPDWLELYNRHPTLPVALQGIDVQTSTQTHRIAALAYIDPLGFIRLFCDERPGVDQLDFKLPASGTTLSILDAVGDPWDAISFGVQIEGVTEGRLPDGTGAITSFPGSASPGASNYVLSYSGPVFNEVLTRSVSGPQTPWGTRPPWFEVRNPDGSPYHIGGMRVGRSLNFNDAWIVPSGTSIPALGYLAIWCDSTQPASTSPGPDLNTGHGLPDRSGGLYLFNPQGQVVNQIEWGPQIADRSIGRISDEWHLLSGHTRGAPNAPPAALGSPANLRINEWAAALSGDNDWIEFYNLDSLPVNLAGLYLSDDPSESGCTRFQFTPLSFAPGRGWVKFEATGNTGAGRHHLNFSLSAQGEHIRLSQNDEARTIIDAISFGLQASSTTEGRIPDGGTVRTGLTPTPAAPNVLPPAPSITAHPNDQSTPLLSSATLSAGATGSDPLSYQWHRNGNPIADATGTAFHIAQAQLSDDAVYHVVVSNSAGSVSSNSARLFVQLTFAQWLASKFTLAELADPSISGPAADPDADGLGNLEEFLHNLDPKSPTGPADFTAKIQLSLEPSPETPQYLIVRYRLNSRALGLTIQPQTTTAPGVSAWQNATPIESETLEIDPATGDGVVRHRFSIPDPRDQFFFRYSLSP